MTTDEIIVFSFLGFLFYAYTFYVFCIEDGDWKYQTTGQKWAMIAFVILWPVLIPIGMILSICSDVSNKLDL